MSSCSSTPDFPFIFIKLQTRKLSKESSNVTMPGCSRRRHYNPAYSAQVNGLIRDFVTLYIQT